jgi:hypothetical protein
MSMQNQLFSRSPLVAALALAALLTACGGGGGGGSPAQPVAGTTFPLQTGIAKLYNAGLQKTMTVSGTAKNSAGTSYPVSGTATFTQSPAGSTTFNGQAAYVSTVTITGNITVNGQTLPVASTDQAYLSTTYSPLGETSASATCVAQTPSSYPATVTIGQTGSVVTYACSSTSQPPTPLGTEVISFVMTPGNSATTATFTSIDTLTNTAGQPVGTTQVNYLIDTSGNLSLISVTELLTLQNGEQANLTFTAQ